jgi:hypothetical protein
MITALVSAVAGLVSGLAPDILKEVKETRAHRREIEFTQLNHQLALDRAKLEVGAKLEESQNQMFMSEVAAAKDSLVSAIQSQNLFAATGIRWIDGVNALVRPMSSLLVMFLFAVTICAYSFGYVNNDAFGTQMTMLFGEMVQAMLGFTFGYRSVSSQKKAAA